jgi:hypothetical protein
MHSDSATTHLNFFQRLRELADPIIPPELYEFCIKNSEDPVRALQVLDIIPEQNRNVLTYLIHFLQVVGDPANQPVTRMSINNIAMVFAPNILRCPSDNLQVILENTKYEQVEIKYVEIILTALSDSFSC